MYFSSEEKVAITTKWWTSLFLVTNFESFASIQTQMILRFLLSEQADQHLPDLQMKVKEQNVMC